MIKLLRVDHRLLHGQVAFSWTQFLGADCILIANDSLMQDELRKTTIKLAKPQGVKVVMKNIQDSISATVNSCNEEACNTEPVIPLHTCLPCMAGAS